MGYVIVYKSNPNNRVRVVDDATKIAELTPYFTYPAQAFNYISKYLNGSPYVKIKSVGGFKMIRDDEFLLKELERVRAKVVKQSEKGKNDYRARLVLIDKVIEFAVDLTNFEMGEKDEAKAD
jgi:hypothetical protein